MAKRMLIDATHPEETRVAVVNGTKLEEYDYENIVRKQLKGNIYLVKVTRVEPSLQAAFVDFGGNRHGFLPFPEIHPDYYRIPIADREALLAEERALAAAQAAKEDEEDAAELAASGETLDDSDDEDDDEDEDFDAADDEDGADEGRPPAAARADTPVLAARETEDEDEEDDDDEEEDGHGEDGGEDLDAIQEDLAEEAAEEAIEEQKAADPSVETVGGDIVETPVFRSSIKRRYKIQEVIKRSQVMLIQISKEERGNKGAAVTTYISLPGRYCVLMPNSPRGGGVSRKVSQAKDRQRLKKILQELNVPEGMSVILRTAGVTRSKAEIKRDLDYLLRLWDEIRSLTLKSTAPALIYEEGNLIKRSIRDLYRREIDEVLVAGEEGFRGARDFMKMLMPSHARKVIQYTEENMPLFSRYQVESQIDAIHSPTVHLKSGGYIVINPTEAMVSIDVNSGRATKGRHIEETALKTNLEAADEIARQLRLRDQGGLIVIDFIDMEDRRGNRIVEKRMREAMQHDRARIQLGRISAFGLMELSRQRLNPSLVETNFETCRHCEGTGLVRTVETTAVIVLRAIEEEALRRRAGELKVVAPTEVALYIFNHKRAMLSALEKRHDIRVFIHADDRMVKPHYEIEVLRSAGERNQQRNKPARAPVQGVNMADMPELEEDIEAESEPAARGPRQDDGDGEREGRRRRGRRGGRRRGGRNRGRGDRDRADRDRDDGHEAAAGDAAGEHRPAARAQSHNDDDGGQREAPARAGREPAASAPPENAPVAVNFGGGGNGGGDKDGNRKGWWKRLTE